MSGDAASPDDTQAAIMNATYRALCEHGYADLTIQTIADEFDKSKSLLYYHYDTKDEILIGLLDYLLGQFTVRVAIDPPDEGAGLSQPRRPDDPSFVIDPTDDPPAQLRSFIDELLPASIDEDGREFQVALLELRSQALSNEAYREQFGRADRLIQDTLADVLRSGVEDGSFRDVDVERTVEHLVSTINGAMLQRATTDDDVTKTREALLAFVDSHLLADQ